MAKREYNRVIREARQYVRGKGPHRDKPWGDLMQLHTQRMMRTGNQKYRSAYAAVKDQIYHKSSLQNSARSKYA